MQDHQPQPQPSAQSVNCAKCGQLPEDILILTCDHNLCLICAARNLQKEHKKGLHSFQVSYFTSCYRLWFVSFAKLPPSWIQQAPPNFLPCFLPTPQREVQSRRSPTMRIIKLRSVVDMPTPQGPNSNIALPTSHKVQASRISRITTTTPCSSNRQGSHLNP